MNTPLSPEAVAFISTAAGIYPNSPDFNVALAYIADPTPPIDRDLKQKPVTLRNILKVDFQPLNPLALMLRTLDSGEFAHFGSMSETERGHWNTAKRVQMIWGYEHTTNLEIKKRWAECLAKLTTQVES